MNSEPVKTRSLAEVSFNISDYGHALIHLAWYRVDQMRFLMFGFVELYPLEFPEPLETPEKVLKLGRLGSRNYIYVKRTCMTSEAALEWYLGGIKGEIVLPDDPDRRGAPKVLLTAGFAQEPQWPQLITASDRIPFVPQSWQSPRMHHLLQPELSADVTAAAADREAMRWLSEQMFVDFETHRELIGSLHLIAPNPILRGIDHRLSMDNAGHEISVLRFRPRTKKAIEGLHVILIDHRPTGLGGLIENEITSNLMQIPHAPGVTDQIETLVLDQTRSILSWEKPTGFIQAVSFNITIGGMQQKIIVPATENQTESTYIRQLRGHESGGTVGEPRSPKEAISLLSAGEARREMKRLDDRYPERWFHGDRESATAFVRDLISNAKEHLWIIDPYFTTVELISYALATSNTTLPVLIVTSAEAMAKSDRINPKRKAAEVLQAQLPNLEKHGNFKIHVLTGTPAVHDRFLVVDDSVWFSGNSLHTIGERAGMVVKLRNSAEIIANLRHIMNSDRTMPWQEWIANRNESNTSRPANRASAFLALATATGVATLGLWKVFQKVVRRQGR